ncbi:unannotated protein [freshwater metagenome]|uniref:Unannotated protein n=2 Tax=freshwater metagenome TaxID=449393 RepID=A0A6J6AXA8_9ZZZZ|nr:DUF805 domain-containing protein [Actinomycetota bacterium]
MQFGDAIKNGFQNYANFRGVASRSEFWYWTLFTVIVSVGTSFIDTAVGLAIGMENFTLINTLAALALMLPGLAVAVRRFHDAGFSAWWYSIPQVATLLALIWFMVALITFIFENMSSLLDPAALQEWLVAISDPNSTAAGDFAYMLVASNVLPSFLALLLIGFATFVFNIIIYVLPSRSVEAGNRHNKPQVAPFTIAG